MAISNAERRERLFDLFSQQFTLGRPDVRDLFVCPLCRRGFTRAALDGSNPAVSLAHIIPASMGGTDCTLTCTPCNNDSGTRTETALLERFLAEDWFAGVGQRNARLEGEFGNVGVDVQLSPETNRWSVFAIPRQSNPAHIEALDQALAGLNQDQGAQLRFSLSYCFRHRPSHVRAAFYQFAFLLMFSYFGYEFAFHPHFALMREQIRHPEQDIWRAPISFLSEESASTLMRERRQAVVFMREPVETIAVILRLQPDGGRERVLGVFLPGLERPEVPEMGVGDFDGSVIAHDTEALLDEMGYLRSVWEETRRPTS